MKKFLRSFAFICSALLASSVAQSQTVTVTADLKSMFGSAASLQTKVCFSLTDGNGNPLSDPRITGVGVIVPTAAQCLSPDGSGHLTTLLYANDAISPPNSIYSVTYLYSGKAIHGDIFQFLVADVTENLNTKASLSVIPVILSPTGDGTYARLDGTNMPFTSLISGNVLLKLAEGSCSGAAAGLDILCADSITHLFKASTNGGAFNAITGVSATSPTLNRLPRFDSGGNLVNSVVQDDGTAVKILVEDFITKTENGKALVKVDQYASWSAALTDCLTITNGCLLDGRSPNTPLTMGTIDPGTAAVTILLGPFTYTIDHFVVRSGLHIYGAGVQNTQGTKLQAVGTGSPFILANSVSAVVVQGFVAQDFELEATVSNSNQDGMFFDVSAGNAGSGSAFEFSKLSRITTSSFKGSDLHLKSSPTAVSTVQMNVFENLNHNGYTGSNTTVGTDLRAEGAVAQNLFLNNIFGETNTGGTRIYVGVTSSTDAGGPYSNWFYGSSIQGGAVGALLFGCQACVFRDTHAELDSILFQVKNGTNWHNNLILLDGGVANGNVGVNSGAGRILDASDASNTQTSTVKLTNWAIEGTPDKLATCVLAASNVILQNITFDSTTPSVSTSNCVPGFSTSTTTFNSGNAHYAFVNGCSGGSVINLTSGLATGESLTLYFNAPCTFAQGGGNVVLNGFSTTLSFNMGEHAVFINSDIAGSNQWLLVSTSAGRANGFQSIVGRTTAISTPLVAYSSGLTDTLYLFTIVTTCKTAVAATTITPTLSYTDPSGTVQPVPLTAATCATLGGASQSFATTGLNVKASTNITITTTITGSPNYDLRVGVIKMGGN